MNRGVWQVSHRGGSQPRWAPDGEELFFFDSTGTLMAVATDTRTLPTVGSPTKVLDPRHVWSVPTYVGRMYDVSTDGNRFLMMKQAGLEDQTNVLTNIVIVQNWFEELQRLVR